MHKFIYESFVLENNKLTFNFCLIKDENKYYFSPVWSFPSIEDLKEDKHDILKISAFMLGMTELVSYWKATLAPEIEIKAGYLNDFSKAFFRKLYIKGLGEFFYKNKLKAPQFEFINTLESKDFPKINEVFSEEKYLIPIGGGKDSALTLEIMKKLAKGKTLIGYMINARKAAKDCLEVSSILNSVSVKRSIDKELLSLNEKGAYNGHTPFSAIVAFSGLFFSLAYGYSYIVLSNESGANEENTFGVNHQYSKSTEFEADFREFVLNIFGENAPCYFSLLRPFSEYKIISEFVKYKQYLKVFQSCNVGQKNDVWCGKCAKCLYVAVMLSAFFSDSEVSSIIKADMLNESIYKEIFKGLLYKDHIKPFECVGTKNDVLCAVNAAIKLRLKKGEKLPLLYKDLNLKSLSLEESKEKPDDNNFLPKHLKGGIYEYFN